MFAKQQQQFYVDFYDFSVRNRINKNEREVKRIKVVAIKRVGQFWRLCVPRCLLYTSDAADE